MPVEITRRGYIEVWGPDGKISQHVSQWKAMESVSKQPDGEYEIRQPILSIRAFGGGVGRKTLRPVAGTATSTWTSSGDLTNISQPSEFLWSNDWENFAPGTMSSTLWFGTEGNEHIADVEGDSGFDVTYGGTAYDGTIGVRSTIPAKTTPTAGTRSEIDTRGDYRDVRPHTEGRHEWIGFAMYVGAAWPVPWPNNPDQDVTVFAHAPETATDPPGNVVDWSPSFAIAFVGTGQILLKQKFPVDINGNPQLTTAQWDLGLTVDTIQDQWSRWVIEVVYSGEAEQNGTLRVWVNDILRLDVTGIRTYASNAVEPGRYKFGIHAPTYDTIAHDWTLRCWYDAITIADGADNGNYGAVDPDGGAPITTGETGLIPGPRGFNEPSLTPTMYVSATATDGAGDGSFGNPYSLTDANAAALAGDVISLRGGDYTTFIRPANSGTSTQRITYQSYPGERPTIVNVGATTTAIRLDNRSYITVNGIDCDGQNHPSTSIVDNQNGVAQARGATIGTWVGMNNATYCEVKQCNLARANGYSGIQFDGTAQFNLVEDCYLDTLGHAAFGQNGDMIDIRIDTKNNWVRHCDLRYAGHNLYRIEGEYNVIEYCTMHNGRWDAIVTDEPNPRVGEFNTNTGLGGRFGILRSWSYYSQAGQGKCVAQYNDMDGSWVGREGLDNGNRMDGARLAGFKNMMRFNTINNTFGDATSLRTITDYSYVSNCWYYNNEVTNFNAGNANDWTEAIMFSGQSTGSDPNASVRDNMIKNNGIGAPVNTAPATIEYRYNAVLYVGDEYSNNRIFNNSFAQSSISVETNASGTLALSQLQTSNPAVAANNVFNALTSATGGDDLTTITSATGSGLSFQVAESYGFHQGISELGKDGDSIAINGVDVGAKITAVDHATGTITVDSSVSWVQGQGISVLEMVSAGNIKTGIPPRPTVYNAFPISPTGFLANDTGITNQNTTYYISDVVDLGGTFTFADGGSFTYTKGASTGTASFVYNLVNYDGAGAWSSATVTVTVQ